MKHIQILSLILVGLGAVAQAADPSNLIRLYEEEVLAHDLYVALSKEHRKVMPLRNIPHSEKRHREAMAGILKEEGVKLPKPGKGRRFVTPGLDDTYKTWLAEGLQSEAAACLVGVRLEDHDIADLRQAITDFPEHKQVLSQLERASHNHLRAFHRNLQSRGGSYKAEALTAADLKSIVDANGGSCGKGKRGCGNAGQKGQGKGQGRR